MKSGRYIDLHIHSTYSDGTFSPAKLAELANMLNVKAMALTDHDTIDGVKSMLIEGSRYGIEVIPGVEMSADFDLTPKGVCHILGYFVDISNEEFIDILNLRKNARRERVFKMVEKLNKLGMKISFEEVVSCAKSNVVGKPHVAQVLLEKGYVSTINEAFDLYIGKGKPAYIETKKCKAEECIEIIKAAHGVSVLAHPMQMKLSMYETLNEIERLKDCGLMGIEAYYASNSQLTTRCLRKIAEENNLLVTCGSDFHGENKKNQLVSGIDGNLFVENYSIVEKLKSARN